MLLETGDIEIITGSLTVNNASQITSQVESVAVGNAGNIIISILLQSKITDL